MTRYLNPRNSLADRFRRSARRLEQEGRIGRRVLVGPGTVDKATPPGMTKWMVKSTYLEDGKVKRRTRAEAAATFAHQTFAGTAVEAGVSGGWYVWWIPEEMDPRKVSEG